MNCWLLIGSNPLPLVVGIAIKDGQMPIVNELLALSAGFGDNNLRIAFALGCDVDGAIPKSRFVNPANSVVLSVLPEP